MSGLEAYRRYGAVALKCVGEGGGGIVWAGAQGFVFIGASEQDWDEVVCVRYPSRQAFLEMIARPDYLAAVAAYREFFRSECAKARIDYLAMDTSVNFDRALMEYLLQRQRRATPI